jgi:hypothetical protein
MPLPLAPVPVSTSGVYGWLAQQPPAVVAEWPFTNALNLADTHDPTYMYFSTAHWRPLANGYSGFHSPDHVGLLFELRAVPTARSIDLLRARNVEYVILHGDLDPERYLAVRDYLANYSADVTLVFGETTPRGEVTVFRLARL